MPRIAALLIAFCLTAAAHAAAPAGPEPRPAAPAAPAAPMKMKIGNEEVEVEVRKARPSFDKPAPIPITWFRDLDPALAEATRTGRLVLVFFTADWCQPCRWMDKGTFAAPAVAQFVLRHFVPLRVDDTGEPGTVSKKYAIRVYPTVLFLAPSGEAVHIELGPRTPNEILPILQRVESLPRLLLTAQQKPDDLEAQFAAGNALALLNQLRGAKPLLSRAAELAAKTGGPRLSQARLLLAVVPLEDGDSAAAMKNIEAWLAEFPGAPEAPVAIYYQGTILYQDGKLDDARRYYEQVRTRFPKHAKAYEADKAIEAIEARQKAEAKQQGEHRTPNIEHPTSK